MHVIFSCSTRSLVSEITYGVTKGIIRENSSHRRNGYAIDSNGTVHRRCRVISAARILIHSCPSDELFNCHAVARSHAPQSTRQRDGTSVCVCVCAHHNQSLSRFSGDGRMLGLRQPTEHNNILNFKFRSICCRLRLACIAWQRTVLRWRRLQHRLRWASCGLCGVSMYWPACQRQWRMPYVFTDLPLYGWTCVLACEGVWVRFKAKYQHCIHCCCFFRFSWDWTAVLFRHGAFTI